MILKTICFFIVFVFAFIGCMVTGIIFHELNHKMDFNEIAYNDHICAFSIPTSFNNLSQMKAGYYEFETSGIDEDEYERISKYTEFKSYAIDIIISIIVIIAIFVTAQELIRKDEKMPDLSKPKIN